MKKELTKRKSTALQRKLGFFIKDYHQPGDTEFGVNFDEANLDQVAKIIGCRPKPQYSDEELDKKRKSMLKARMKSNKS